MKKDGKKFKEFFDGLFEDSRADTNEIKKDLEALGVNYQRIEIEVDQILQGAQRQKKLSWLDDARKTRSKIAAVLEKQSQEMRKRYGDVRELVDAIRNGQFGTPLQQHAHAFFRNQDFKKLSEQDLISFVTDCQLLDALQGKDEDEC